VLHVEGVVRQDIAYGESLSLTRRYESRSGSDSVRLVDTVTNDGWFETRTSSSTTSTSATRSSTRARAARSSRREPQPLGYSTGDDGGERTDWRSVTAPQPGFTFEGYVVSLGRTTAGGRVALVNRGCAAGSASTSATTARAAAYLAWRMMREGLYAIGLEPATNPFGNPRS
jgi:hypothetical protein